MKKNLTAITLLILGSINSVSAQWQWLGIDDGYGSTSIQSTAVRDSIVWISKDQSILEMSDNGDLLEDYQNYELPVPAQVNFYSLAINDSGDVYVAYKSIPENNGGVLIYHSGIWINNENIDLPALTNESPSNMLIDDSSRIWIAFNNVLSVFDGSTWTNFQCSQLSLYEYFGSIQFQNDTLLLCTSQGKIFSFHDNVFEQKYDFNFSIVLPEIKVDQLGDLWVCLYYSLVRIHNGVMDTFNHNNSPLDYESKRICFDSSNNLYYFGKYNGSYYVYDGVSWTQYTSPLAGSEPVYIQGEILYDKKGRIWLGQHNKNIFKFEGGSWTQFEIAYSILPSDNVLSVNGWDPWNLHAYAITGTDNGLVGIGSDNDNFPVNFYYDSLNSILESNTITCLAHSFSYPYIQAIGTYSGLYLLYPDSNIWIHFDTSNSPLPNDTINYLMNDWDDLWVATNGGLAIVDLNFNWTIWDTSNTPLPSNHINSIYNKNLYPWGYFICTQKGVGIFMYPDSTWKILNTNNSGLPENDVTSIYYNWGDYMLFGTRSFGIADSLLDSTWIYFNTGSGLPSDSITFMGPGTDLIAGDTWIGSKGGGLIYFNNGDFIGSVNSADGIDFRNANDAAFSDNFEHATAWVATDKGILAQDFGSAVPSVTHEQFPLSAYFDGNDLNITFEIKNATQSTIELFDLMGRKLAASKQKSLQGRRSVRMTVPSLSSGIYIVNMSAGGLRQAVKVLKME